MKKANDDTAEAQATLAAALNKSEMIQDNVEACADGLAEVNTTLKQELMEHSSEAVAHKVLGQNNDIQGKVQQCAEDLETVNASLGQELADRHVLEKKLSESQAQEKKNYYLAYHDITTGLANRALFNDRLDRTLVQARRHGGQFAVLFIDLDKFKAINDSHGHDIGDKVLIQVGNRLKAFLREEDTLSRTGGDEFLCLLMDINRESAVAQIAESVLGKISEIFEISDLKLTVGLSIGIAMYPRDGETAEALLKNADSAMYEAKRNAHGYRFFNQHLAAK